MPPSVNFAPRRLVHWLVLMLGIGMTALGLAIPALLPDKDLWLLGLVLLTLACGAIALSQGWCALQTELVVRADGFHARLPRWAGGMYPPLRKIDLPWNEVRSIQSRRRVYYPLGIPMPINELVLTTEHGQIVIAPAFCRNLPAFAQEVADRIKSEQT